MMKDLNSTLASYNIKNNTRIMMLGDIPLSKDPNQDQLDTLSGYRKTVEDEILPKMEQLKQALDGQVQMAVKEIDYLQKAISETLLQLLLKVDNIQSDAEVVRAERKDTVKFINQYLDMVDNLKPFIKNLKAGL
jgi:hypothetical protein